MQQLATKIGQFYRACLTHPLAVLLALSVMLGIAAFYSRGFYYDASADTLVAENDPELAYYRKVSQHFGGEAFLFLTFTPKDKPLFTRDSLTLLGKLVEELRAINGVRAVESLLDAPLLKSPPVPLSELASNFRTLKDDTVDLAAAKEELRTSPLFANLLISSDGATTALRVDLASNKQFEKLAQERNKLRALDAPSPKQLARLAEVTELYRIAYAADMAAFNDTLRTIRSIRDKYSTDATIYMGGVPMIAADMIAYIKRDVVMFGALSLLLMIGALFMFFRSMRWVLLPLLVTAATVLVTVGVLGFLHKPVTVISSNFISLLIIFSISIVVHLITRYLEEVDAYPERPPLGTVYATMANKLAPCVYTTLTTMAGFASLQTSSIVPVMDFGWIMCLGVVVAFLMAFIIFPAVVVQLPTRQPSIAARDTGTPLIRLTYHLSARRTGMVLAASVVLAVITVLGILRISMDNRFLDYFREKTEIYQGLAFIDRELGGTIPMEVILTFPPFEKQELADDDDFFAEDTGTADTFPERYWFTPDKIAVLHRLHSYLDTRSQVGKTISLATFESIAQEFNDGKPLTAPEIVAVLGAIPEDLREDFIYPYANPNTGMMRLSLRVHETGPAYPRAKLIAEIRDYATTELGLPPENVRLTGMNVLFNGMLQQLFTSQTSTLLFVIGATFAMFMALLRSFQLAVIGLLPNILSAFSMIAFMGYMGIPLDMMTITIAAIVIGIGVDDAIHYLHRFRESYADSKCVNTAIRRSHREIGRAIYFTSLTVVIGFSVLVLSNFIPSVYFGILTSLAMLLALFANLTLLPALLIRFYK